MSVRLKCAIAHNYPVTEITHNKQFSLNVQLSSKACEPLPVILIIKDKLSFVPV